MTSDVDPKTILLRGDPLGSEAPAATGAGITPGMLLERTTAGEVQPHSTPGGLASPMFAREADYVGDSIDAVAADGETVPIWDCRKGDQVYGFLAAGENVSLGAYLESDGAGAFQAHTAGTPGTTFPGNAIVKAAEAVDNGAGGSAVRIRLEVL